VDNWPVSTSMKIYFHSAAFDTSLHIINHVTAFRSREAASRGRRFNARDKYNFGPSVVRRESHREGRELGWRQVDIHPVGLSFCVSKSIV